MLRQLRRKQLGDLVLCQSRQEFVLVRPSLHDDLLGASNPLVAPLRPVFGESMSKTCST